VNRVRRREMTRLFGEDEVLDGGLWPVARSYIEWGGKVSPREGEHRWAFTPLDEPDVFLSFARLAARGEPSKDTILGWVNEYGLLRRRDPTHLYFLPGGEVNQEPASVEEIAKEIRRAYQLLHIFELYRSDDTAKLRARMSLRGLYPKGVPSPAEATDLLLLDGEPIPHPWSPQRDRVIVVRGKDLTDEIILAASKRFVQAAIEPYIADLYFVFGIRERLNLRCPDLITAMYFQFAALVDGRRPSDICEGCGKVFPKRRRDQKVCDATCRSRKHRKPKAV
jgi:hypothetical protein